MRRQIRKGRIQFLRPRNSLRHLAGAILSGVLLLGAQSGFAEEAPQGCQNVPESVSTLVDCCCTDDQCATDSCRTDTCSNDTCKYDSCDTETCSVDTCKVDTCTTDTCSRDTCKVDTCETDTCTVDDCDADTCKSDTCANDTCKVDTCDADTCSRDTCSRDTCSYDSCFTQTCSTETCSYDSCETATCGSDGCNFVDAGGAVEVRYEGVDGNQCLIPSFGADKPDSGTAILYLLDGRRRHVEFNETEVSVGRRKSFQYQMNFLPDASRDSTYVWKIADKSSAQLSITGTTRVGPFQGVMQRPSHHNFSVQARESLRGTKQWIRFEIEENGEVINEVHLFLDVK